MRIRGELLKLGHRVSASSVRNLLRRHCIPPAPRRAGLTWRQFLRAHGRTILACDYFTVETVFLKRLYVLFFLELASRRIVFTACGEHPGGGWAAQQARLAWELQEAEIKPRFLIHDRDSNFPAAFDTVFRAEGLEVIRTPVRAPNANARCERWISSARRECLDWLLIVSRRQLEVVLAEYVEHYNRFRPHRSLGLLPPRGSPAVRADDRGPVTHPPTQKRTPQRAVNRDAVRTRVRLVVRDQCELLLGAAIPDPHPRAYPHHIRACQ